MTDKRDAKPHDLDIPPETGKHSWVDRRTGEVHGSGSGDGGGNPGEDIDGDGAGGDNAVPRGGGGADGPEFPGGQGRPSDFGK